MSMWWSKCNVDHWTCWLKQSHLFLSLKERGTNWEQNLMRTWSCSHSHEGCKNMDGASFGCLHQLPAMVDDCTGHSWQPALKLWREIATWTSNVRGEQCFNASFFSFGRKKRQQDQAKTSVVFRFETRLDWETSNSNPATKHEQNGDNCKPNSKADPALFSTALLNLAHFSLFKHPFFSTLMLTASKKHDTACVPIARPAR